MFHVNYIFVGVNGFVLALLHGRGLIVFSLRYNLEASHKIRYSSLIYLLDNFM